MSSIKSTPRDFRCSSNSPTSRPSSPALPLLATTDLKTLQVTANRHGLQIDHLVHPLPGDVAPVFSQILHHACPILSIPSMLSRAMSVRPPQVRYMFFPTMHLPHLHLWFHIVWGFILSSKLTHPLVPNRVPARQVIGLPPTSFRFRLATNTLVFGYALGATSCARDFHPLDHALAGRTTNKNPTGNACRWGLTCFVWRKLYGTISCTSSFLMGLTRSSRLTPRYIAIAAATNTDEYTPSIMPIVRARAK